MNLSKDMLRVLIKNEIAERAKDGVNGKEDPKEPSIIKGGSDVGDYNKIKMDALYLKHLVRQELEIFLKKFKQVSAQGKTNTGCSYNDILNFVRTYNQAEKGK